MLTINLLRADINKSLRSKSFRIFLFYAQIFIMCMATGSATWHLVSVIKSVFITDNSSEFNAWTTLFFNPVGGTLFNYLASSLIMLVSFSYFYSKLQTNSYSLISFIYRRVSFHNKFIMLLTALLFVIFSVKSCNSLVVQTTVSISLLLISFTNIKYYKLNLNIFLAMRRMFFVFCILLLGVIGFEAFNLIKGPVKVLSEFLPLPSSPQITKGEYINIKELSTVPAPNLQKGLQQDYIKEYFYQLSNRGVFNHIGHVLNPINEYLGGKPPSKIYFQYGIGFSFVYKWTMELFGGVSVQNYYKCHIYYVLYWAAYVLISVYLFRSSFYVIFSVLALVSSFFFLGYDAFVVAPGINPLIHFFDLPLLYFLFRYFNSRKANDLILAYCTGIVAVFLNQQFGLFGMFAAGITLAMFYFENYSGLKRLQLFTLLPAAIFLPLAFSRVFLPVATDSVFGYFFKGYFSSAPDRRFVAIIITNTVFSYVFLLWKKSDRTPFKYLFIFLFFYFQALLVYYFQSGYLSHFWPLFPIMVLQMLVMIKTVDPLTSMNLKILKTILTTAVLTAFILMTVNAAKFYYKQKKSYLRVFKTHKVFSWDFERAKIISTIDPAPLNDSIEILRQYSGTGDEGKGVFIISVFDNIIPMLSERYSLMPFFEMQWFLITKKEVEIAVSRIQQIKPQYIFVGHEVEAEQFVDPWLIFFDESVFKEERFSAAGRLQVLRNVFLAICVDYKPIKSGTLLTVYQLKN